MKTSLSIHQKKTKSMVFFIFSMGVFAAATFSFSASAGRTQFDRNLQDIGASVTGAIDLDAVKSPHEAYIAAMNCKQSVENHRVHVAAIFGDNNLDDITAEGITQCNSPLGKETPPTGRLFRIRDNVRRPMGSGDVVLKNDVVVTTAHSFKSRGVDKILPTDKVVFAIYEKDHNGSCKRVDYEVIDYALGTEDNSRDPGNDFAVLKLSRPMTSYYPLELPPESLVREAQYGEQPIALMGFAGHRSTGYGEDISVMSCSGQLPPATQHYYSNVENAFLHDCDVVGGLSGGAFSVIDAPQGGVILAGNRRQYIRYLVGIQTTAMSENEGVSFDAYNEYNAGIALNSNMRSMIKSMADGDPIIRTADLNAN